MDAEIIKGDTSIRDFKIGIVVARWNSFITDELLQGALNVLENKGFDERQIVIVRCPGSYEIPFTSKMLLKKVDGIITLGAVIRGETPHFEYVCDAVNRGVVQLNMDHKKPVVFGVLTTDTVEQASERATENSDFGNKGAEAALALIEMLSLKQKIEEMES